MPISGDFFPPILAKPTPHRRDERPSPPAPPQSVSARPTASLRRMTMLPEDALLRIRQGPKAEGEETNVPGRTGRG